MAEKNVLPKAYDIAYKNVAVLNQCAGDLIGGLRNLKLKLKKENMWCAFLKLPLFSLVLIDIFRQQNIDIKGIIEHKFQKKLH